jgi:hypothetical protein
VARRRARGDSSGRRRAGAGHRCRVRPRLRCASRGHARGEWQGLLDWLRNRAVADGRIDAADIDSLTLAVRPRDALEAVEAGYRRQLQHGRRQPRRA